MYKTKEDVINRVQEHHNIAIEKYGNRVIGTFLQGSWNYSFDLCDEESDKTKKQGLTFLIVFLSFDNTKSPASNRSHQ